MTRKEAIKTLRSVKRYDDIELGHIEADKVLCELLASLGYEDVIKAYDKVVKWYV
jgi:hypothetical protein